MVAPTDFVRTVCDKLRFSVEIEKLVYVYEELPQSPSVTAPSAEGASVR